MKNRANMIMPGDPLMIEAAEALRSYHLAQADGKPAQEIERCRLLAELLFQTISDFNLEALEHNTQLSH